MKNIKYKIIIIQAEMMINGEFNCCLWLLIVCNKRIKIIFRGSDGVSLLWEMKIEMLKFYFLKKNSNDNGEF